MQQKQLHPSHMHYGLYDQVAWATQIKIIYGCIANKQSAASTGNSEQQPAFVPMAL